MSESFSFFLSVIFWTIYSEWNAIKLTGLRYEFWNVFGINVQKTTYKPNAYLHKIPMKTRMMNKFYLPGVYVACSDELSDVCSVANGLVGFGGGIAIAMFELLGPPWPGAGCDVTGPPPSISLKSSWKHSNLPYTKQKPHFRFAIQTSGNRFANVLAKFQLKSINRFCR